MTRDEVFALAQQHRSRADEFDRLAKALAALGDASSQSSCEANAYASRDDAATLESLCGMSEDKMRAALVSLHQHNAFGRNSARALILGMGEQRGAAQ